MLSVVPAFLAFAVIPFGPVVDVPFTDDMTTPLQPDGHAGGGAVRARGRLDRHLRHRARRLVERVDVLLLGGLRSSAQMISYEVAMGLALVAVFLYAGSMSTSAIVEAQERLWFGLILIPSFVIYVIAMVGDQPRPLRPPRGRG